MHPDANFCTSVTVILHVLFQLGVISKQKFVLFGVWVGGGGGGGGGGGEGLTLTSL